ncbi:MAG: 2-phospho-L-lactate transferase [Betaproteobacteria bacterium]|nr:2-phospho-L-lactate transferase [Betaproteobacteria bacterium]
MILTLSGGVGGAKLAAGLAAVLPPQELAVVCNTGDDFEHLGLPISPDLDTVIYTLGGRSNTAQGWGLADESWRVIGALADLGGDTWFRLGDLDIATHLYRLSRRRAGGSLTDITAELCAGYGVRHPVWPMTDDPVRTMVQVPSGPLQGELAFQHYFVRERCQPPVSAFRFNGIEHARPQPRMMELLAGGKLGAVVICPSNPFVSVDPIIRLPGLRDGLRASGVPVIAVSPIVGGRAIKGPAAKMMQELGMPVTARAVAGYYGDLLDGFVIDHADAADAAAIESLGPVVQVTRTVMTGARERMALARDVLRFAATLGR